ncbi:hypothetical protein [Salinarchaeum laminariae]|uniref:hypothetical protein n=1 Tax=Salinarchaeum laminariae TaxID=869888 RepID=UPI0020C00EA5|nr:hypothetical protein [Salinarchaeum laminariae]
MREHSDGGDPGDGADARSDGGVELSERVERSGGAESVPDLWCGEASEDPTEGIAYELDVYAGLLEGLLARGYEFVGFEGAIADGEIALRHDVDISLARAAAMARAEAELGVTSTYCVLVTNPLYDLLAPDSRRHLHTILSAGHDVGLHFDPHYYWEAEPVVEDLEARVLEDRAALEHALSFVAREQPGPVAVDSTVVATSIHQPPEWALGATFDAFENTYEPAYFTDVAYVSDSGGKWRSERPFTEGVPDAMQLLVHPGLWGSADRSLATILEHHREQCHDRIERYVGPFGG